MVKRFTLVPDTMRSSARMASDDNGRYVEFTEHEALVKAYDEMHLRNLQLIAEQNKKIDFIREELMRAITRVSRLRNAVLECEKRLKVEQDNPKGVADVTNPL